MVPSDVQLDIGAFSHVGHIQTALEGFKRQLSYLPHELPLLADMSVNLLERLTDMCSALEGFAMSNRHWPSWRDSEAGEKADVVVLTKMIFCLSAANEFLKLVKAILLEVE